MNVVYDAGVLVAIDRSDRRIWADHKIRLEMGILPIVTSDPDDIAVLAAHTPRPPHIQAI